MQHMFPKEVERAVYPLPKEEGTLTLADITNQKKKKEIKSIISKIFFKIKSNKESFNVARKCISKIGRRRRRRRKKVGRRSDVSYVFTKVEKEAVSKYGYRSVLGDRGYGRNEKERILRNTAYLCRAPRDQVVRSGWVPGVVEINVVGFLRRPQPEPYAFSRLSALTATRAA